MYCKVFKVIDNNGLVDEVKNLKLNEEVLIFDAKKSDNLRLKKSTGDILTFGKIINILFDGVLLIKTEEHTWIFEQL